MKQRSASSFLGLCSALLALTAHPNEPSPQGTRVKANAGQSTLDVGATGSPPSGQLCTLIGCGPAMMLTRHIDASFEELRSSTMTLCRNKDCYTLRFANFSKPDEHGNMLFNRAYYPMYGQQVDGMPNYDASVFSAPGGGFKFSASFTPWSHGERKDGDVYAVRVVTSKGRKLIDVRRTVTYKESWPNGPQCGSVCRTSRLD